MPRTGREEDELLHGVRARADAVGGAGGAAFCPNLAPTSLLGLALSPPALFLPLPSRLALLFEQLDVQSGRGMDID